MGRRAVDESNPWASLCPAGEKKGRKQMCVSNLCSWKKKKQENWFSNPGNLRLTESMSISLDSPCQTVCLHLPFLSLTTKLGSCLTRAALGCTCPFITFLWKKKKSLSDLVFETAHKNGPKKEGVKWFHLAWWFQNLFQIFILFFLVLRSILFITWVNAKSKNDK